MFEAGQEVKYQGMRMPATIISGPHPSAGKARWLIRKADDNVSLVPGRDLTPVPSERERLAHLALNAATERRVEWGAQRQVLRDQYLRIADAILADKAANEVPERPPLAVGDRIRTLKSLFNPRTMVRVPADTWADVHSADSANFLVSVGGEVLNLSRSAEGLTWERV